MLYAINSLACTLSTQYMGHVNVTKNGIPCQMWSSQTPQSHAIGILNSDFPDKSVAAARNYCRDPDYNGYLWCYTTDPNVRWDVCAISCCSK